MTNKFKFRAIMLISMLLSINQVWGATDYSETHTSSVTLIAGTSASAVKVSISDTEYDAMKLGGSKSTGSLTFSIPAGTTKLYIHTAGWKGDGAHTLNITSTTGTASPSSISLTNDNNISGTATTFTLDPTTASTTYYSEVTMSNVTSASTITLATSAKRAVVWGVHAEAGAATYTLSYAAGGGSGTGPADVTGKKSGDEVTLAANSFTAPSGKKFSGWNDGTSTYNAGATYTMPASDVTMTAQWSNITYTDYLTECSSDPSISVSPSSITGLGYVFGSAASASTVKTFTVTGSYLESNKVTITAPTGFEVKTSTGNFTDEIELTPNDGSINETISVRLSSGKTVNTYNGDVTVSCSGAGLESKTVALTGEVTAAKLTSPSVTATPGVHLITLTWSAVANADSYTVTCTGATVGDVTTSAGTCTCVLSNLTGGTEYSYSVVAVGSGNYANSDAAQGSATAGKEQFTVTFKNNGVTLLSGGTRNVDEGDAIGELPTLTSSEACDASSTTFVGWTAQEITEKTSTAPTLISASTTVTGVITYNAVWAEGDNAFSIVDELSLVTDAKYIILGFRNDAEEGDTDPVNFAMSNTIANKLVATETSLTFNEYEEIETSNTAIIWQLARTDNKVTLYNAAINKYLAVIADDKYAQFSMADTPESFTISADDGGEGYADTYHFASTTYSGQQMRFYQDNTNGFGFRAYNSYTYPIYLYKNELDNYITKCATTGYVTYDGNGNTSGSVPVDGTEYTFGTSVTVLGNTGSLAKDHHDFVGWNTQADGEGTTYTTGQTFTISKSTTLYAKWTPKTYQVTWSINGDGTDKTDVVYNNKVSAMHADPADDACPGKVFKGWRATAIDGEQDEVPSGMFTTVEGSPVITGNTTFYAVFAKQEVSGDGNYTLVEAAPADWSGTYLIVDNTSTKCFDGSLTTLDADNNMQAVTITNKVITGSSTIDGYAFTISASTTASKYYVQSASGYYIGSNASSSNDLVSSTTQKYDNGISYSASGITIQGTSNTLKFSYADNTKLRFRYYKSTSSSVRLPYLYKKSGGTTYSKYATTCSQLYDIVLDKNGGSANGSAKVLENGTTLTNITEPTYSGKGVVGYYKESGCTNKVANANGSLQANVAGYTDGDGKWIGTTATLYTKWATLYSYSYTDDICDAGQAAEGAEVTLCTAPEVEHKDFTSWTVLAGDVPVTVTAGKFTMPASNVTITANYTQRTYTVTTNDNGVATEHVVNEGESYTMPALSCSGDDYTKVGWTATAPTDHVWASKPTIVNVGSTVSAGGTYYAVYGQGSGDPTSFTKVTSSAGFESGANYMFVYNNDGTLYAMTGSFDTNHYTSTTVTATNDQISNSNSLYVWTIISNAGAISFQNVSTEKYIGIDQEQVCRKDKTSPVYPFELAWNGATVDVIRTESKSSEWGTDYLCASSSADYEFSIKYNDNNHYLYKSNGTMSYLSNPTCVMYYDITNITVDPAGYGSVDKTSVTHIPSGTTLSTNNNVLTVNTDPVVTVTATPTAATAQYTYTFDSWSNVPDAVTENISNIVANFTRTVNNYNVTATLTNVTAGTAFPAQLPYGGSFSTTISANTGYNLPASISVSGATSNWNASTGELTISDVTGAVTVTISGQIKTYAVTLAKNEDWGTIDPTALADVNHGTAISIDGSDSKILRIGSSTVTATPATNTAQYTYGWTGWTWEPAGATITAATTATANFTRTLNQYTITFENEDGTVLQSGLVNYGETPTYSGATPTKDPTAQYTYTFAGWNPAITTVTAAATYTATYTPATRVYNVGTTLTHVTATPAIPATVEYGGGFSTTITADAGYSLPSTISVAGGTPNWNQSTGSLIVTDVTGDVSITIVGEVATYRSVYLNTTTEWSTNSPDFYAHTWGSTTLDPVKMTAVGCQSNVFTASIPVGNTNIIFVRIKPGQPFAWNGDNFWGQTNDLTLEGDKNYFTISGWSDGKGVGNWSTYVPVSFTVSFNKNNGEGDDKASITNIGCQGSALLPTNDWTRTGYDANGWNTAANGSGTHYDDGATITDITANIPLYAEWSSNHPGTVTVSGTYHYWEGETIELTASVQYPERLKPSATYTWKRNGVVVEGQTTNVLSIPSCVFDNAGVYTCTVANGGAESTSSNFGVKILAFVLKNADGSTISTTVLTKPAEGTVVVLPAFNLANENSTYKFCVIDGAGGRFGNDGQMTDKNCTNWAMDKDNDCRILTSGAGNYTFSVDYANIGQPKVSVTYPDHDQAENYPIYFDNSQGWSTDKLYYRIGASTTLCSEAMTLVPGTSRLYTTVTKKYDSFLAWHIGNNCGWTGDNSIYKTKTGDSYAITNSTSFIKSIVGETGVTVTITDQHSIGLSDENNNCEFYETATTAGLMTHTATVTAPMNGTITLNWTDITGTAQKATATTAGLAHTCNLTITATPATGYELTSLTVNGVDFTSGSVHVLDADATIAATFSAASYSVTLNTNGGTINSGNVTSYTYGVGATLPTDVTKSGADFGGWFAESDFSGERVYSIGDSETGNKTFYALWTYLFAYNCNGGTCTGEYSTVCDTYMSVPEGTEMTVTTGTPTKTGYTFDGWQVNGAGDYLHGGDKVTVNQTTELVAHFTAQLVNYTVNHYQQNVDGTYPSSPTDVDNLQAYTGASVTPDRKDYGTGFNTPSGKQVTIAGDGSTVVNYQYSRTTHTITWTLDDGFDTQWYKQTSIRYGAQPTYKSSDPATSDCDYERVFVGWLDHKIAWDAREASAPTGMFQKESAPTVSGDANYYAVFANYAEEVYSNYATACVKKYVITGFSDANGNSITADYEQAAAGETVTLTVTTADGWKNKSYSVVKTTSQSTIVEVTDNQFTMPAYDVTVKATFVPVHRVFFHVPSGGCITAPTTIELETSEVVPTLPAPTGTIPGGWTFAGWSLTEVTTESTTMPNLMYSGGYLENDVDVYALYQKAGTETLTFDQFLSGSTYNSAYFVISSLYSTAEHALPNTTSISSGKIASTTITSVSDGMVTNASEIAATKMLFRKISSTEVQIMNVNNMFLDGKDGNLKLSTTAVTWTKGGSGTQANPVRFTINSKALRINSTNEYGHYAASATQVNDTKILAISNNTVYYLTDADCIEKWYVTYDANGGETTCESGKKVAEGFTICADAPTRDHYTFGGWSDGVSTYDAGAAYSLTKNVTFTAQWTLVQHTVTFNNNGVTLDEGGTRQVGYGTAVGALPQLTEDQAVDCNGRSVIFMGWMEGEIDPRDDNPTITYITPSTVIDGNKTYNAVWAEGVEEEVEP